MFLSFFLLLLERTDSFLLPDTLLMLFLLLDRSLLATSLVGDSGFFALRRAPVGVLERGRPLRRLVGREF